MLPESFGMFLMMLNWTNIPISRIIPKPGTRALWVSLSLLSCSAVVAEQA